MADKESLDILDKLTDWLKGLGMEADRVEDHLIVHDRLIGNDTNFDVVIRVTAPGIVEFTAGFAPIASVEEISGLKEDLFRLNALQGVRLDVQGSILEVRDEVSLLQRDPFGKETESQLLDRLLAMKKFMSLLPGLLSEQQERLMSEVDTLENEAKAAILDRLISVYKQLIGYVREGKSMPDVLDAIADRTDEALRMGYLTLDEYGTVHKILRAGFHEAKEYVENLRGSGSDVPSRQAMNAYDTLASPAQADFSPMHEKEPIDTQPVDDDVEFADEETKRDWEIYQAATKLAETLPYEEASVAATAVTFDPEHKRTGMNVIFASDMVIPTEKRGVYLVSNRSLRIMQALGIRYQTVELEE